MCVCVCVCVYMYVCVCVCAHRHKQQHAQGLWLREGVLKHQLQMLESLMQNAP